MLDDSLYPLNGRRLDGDRKEMVGTMKEGAGHRGIGNKE
jgi:hypothetical protein